MKNILVTGATGLLGHNIVKKLSEKSGEGRAALKIRVLVRDKNKAALNMPAEVDFYEGNITDESTLTPAFRGVDTVFHAAGLPEQWLADESLFNEVNVKGTQHVLDAAEQAGVDRFIFTSTIDVFKSHSGQSLDESQLDEKPKATAYERSKQQADRLAVETMFKGLHIVFIHPAAVYGPGPLTSPGINQLFIDLAHKKVPALLPGSLPLVYAPDCAAGHIAAAEKGKAGERFILCEGTYELTDIAGRMSSLLELKKLPPQMPLFIAKAFSGFTEGVASITKKRPVLPKGQLHFLQWGAKPDATRAIERLAWQATPLDDALAETYMHLKKEELL